MSTRQDSSPVNDTRFAWPTFSPLPDVSMHGMQTAYVFTVQETCHLFRLDITTSNVRYYENFELAPHDPKQEM